MSFCSFSHALVPLVCGAFFSLAIYGSCHEESCSDSPSCGPVQTNLHPAAKYREGAEKYEGIRDAISAANAAYIPCESDDCSCFLGTIDQDLAPFSSGITRDMMDKAASLFSEVRGVRYIISNGTVHREKQCTFPARCEGVEHFLKEIAGDLKRPVEFVLNDFDWPKVAKRGVFPPVFSFSKTAAYGDIMYPAWSFWSGGPAISLYPTGIGRWDKVRGAIQQAAKSHPWEEKIPKAFFRGSRTSPERDSLILLSRKNPDLLDAQYTKNQAWKSPKDTLGAEPAKEASFEEHCKYKYLFNFRGVAASFRLRHLFLCGSVVFHVGDEWQEFFYSALKPWIHYIPIKGNPTEDDLKLALDFVKDNDDAAGEIAAAGYSFIAKQLKFSDVSCYWRELLLKYSDLLKFEPRVEPHFIRIR